jgi:hypothetical protein
MWDDDIKTYVGDIMLEGVDWIHLTQETDQRWVVVNMVMNPKGLNKQLAVS